MNNINMTFNNLNYNKLHYDKLKEIVKSSTYLQTCCDFINNNSDKRVACENCPVQEYMKEQKNG